MAELASLGPCLAAFLLSAAPTTCLAIKNGEPTQAYAAVGLLLKSEGEGFVPACSGVLISPQSFLTAAHCLDGGDARQYAIFHQHAGVTRVASFSTYCGETPRCAADLAILNTDETVPITPSPIAERIADYATFHMIGFGISDPDGSDYGIKRVGIVERERCPSVSPWSLCFRERSERQLNCFADSGGPLIVVSDNGHHEIAGIMRASLGPCGIAISGSAADMTAAPYRQWVENLIMFDRSVATNEIVSEFQDELSEQQPTRRHDVAAWPRGEIVVTLSYGRASDQPNRFLLELPGNSGTYCPVQLSSITVCRSDARSEPWVIGVQRQAGKGLYQLTIVSD